MLWRDRKSGALLDFDVRLSRRVGALPIKMKFDFDFLKDRYDDELKRKEQITAALTLPVSVLVVLAGGWVSMMRSFSYMDGFLTCWFLIFLCLAAVAFWACVVYVGRAYIEPYIYLPHLGDLHKARETSLELYNQVFLRQLNEEEFQSGSYDDSSQHEEYADNVFERSLEMRIIEATDANTKTNDRRSHRYLYRARLAIFFVLVSIAIAGVPYGLDQVRY